MIVVEDRVQAFKFELMPNGEQLRWMRRWAGSCRWVYNDLVAAHNIKEAGLALLAWCFSFSHPGPEGPAGVSRRGNYPGLVRGRMSTVKSM